MTDAIQVENARILRHAVSVRDKIVESGPFLFGHIAEVPGWHPVARRMRDFLDICRAYLNGFNEDIAAIDPGAMAVELALAAAPVAPGTPGTMLIGDEINGWRNQKLGEASTHRRTLLAFERERRNIDAIDMGPINNKRMMHLPLTDEEEAEEGAFYTWSNFQTALLEADDAHSDAIGALDDLEALQAYDVTTGWPDA